MPASVDFVEVREIGVGKLDPACVWLPVPLPSLVRLYLKAWDITLDEVCLPFQADNTVSFRSPLFCTQEEPVTKDRHSKIVFNVVIA